MGDVKDDCGWCWKYMEVGAWRLSALAGVGSFGMVLQLGLLVFDSVEDIYPGEIMKTCV